jgi:hypothetical protein
MGWNLAIEILGRNIDIDNTLLHSAGLAFSCIMVKLGSMHINQLHVLASY